VTQEKQQGRLVMTDVLRGKQILIVEDQFLIAADLCHALQALGADVVGPTGHIEEALYLASHAMIDGALADINLGNTMAYAVIDRLVQRGVPFLLLTGYDTWDLPSSMQTCARLTKPVTAEIALGKLAEILLASGTGSPLNRGA
jgi:CheY-like chemotaxis protein